MQKSIAVSYTYLTDGIPKTLAKMFLATLFSCGGGISDYSEELSGGFVYWNEGEGLNSISSKSIKIRSINWIKKYADDGKYICIWQADSAELLKIVNISTAPFKPNTYYPSDKFWIIDIENDSLMGPYQKELFFEKVNHEEIEVKWKPEVRD